MLAKFIAKYGRKLVMWAVVALASSLASKAMERWARGDDSIETSGTFDLDSELEVYFSALGKVRFEFSGKTSMVEISRLIGGYVLK